MSFLLSDGGGVLANASVHTDEAGVASSGRWTLDTLAGEHTVTARAAGLPASVLFTAAAEAGPVARIRRVGGSGQSAAPGATLPNPLRVWVGDSFYNPVAGAAVTFSVVSGGGELAGAETVTGVDGVATSGAWTLGSPAGFQRAVAQAGPVSTEFVAESCPAETSCAVIPRIAFVRSWPSSGIHTVNFDGSEMDQRTSGRDYAPVWSPDGARIAFSRYYEDIGGSEIHVMNADGSGATSRTIRGDHSYAPAWTPDGQKIAFVRQASIGSTGPIGSEIYLMSAHKDGARPTLFLSTPMWVSSLSWSPDGARIAIDMNGIRLMNVDGSGAMWLTPPPHTYFRGSVAWSPDASRIAVTLVENCDFDDNCDQSIVLLNADGSGMTRLVPGTRANSVGDPAWSPDGATIAFTEWSCAPQCSISVGYVRVEDGARGVIVTDGQRPSWRP